MAKGLQQFEKSGSEFLNLKDGDRATVIVTDEPMLIEAHKLADDTKYGQKYLCGLKERNACPVCEDDAGRFTAAEKKTAWRAYYPVWVATITRKGGAKETVEEHQLHEGGAPLNKGYMACHETLAEYGGSLIGKPVIVARTGDDKSTSYAVQAHPDPKFAIAVPEGAIDAEQYVVDKIGRDWEATPQREDKHGDKPDPFQGEAFDKLAGKLGGKKLVNA